MHAVLMTAWWGHLCLHQMTCSCIGLLFHMWQAFRLIDAVASFFQGSLLCEMEESRARSQGAVEAWAQQVEAVITQELDGRLRAHRPRAGRLEEEVRPGRRHHTPCSHRQAHCSGGPYLSLQHAVALCLLMYT
jgi:hypothetical protein